MTLTFEFQGQIAAIFKYYMIEKVFINAFHLKYPYIGISEHGFLVIKDAQKSSII